MNRLFALLFASSCLTAAGQVPDYVPIDGLEVWLSFDSSLVNDVTGTNVGSGNVDAYDEEFLGIARNSPPMP